VETVPIAKQGESAPEIVPKSILVESKQLTFIRTLVRESVAVLVWLSLIVKLFIFDFDVYLLAEAWPQGRWIVQYKFFFIGGLSLVWWLCLGTKRALAFAGYVLIYPIVVIFWKVPKRLFKNWAALLIFLPTITAFFKSLKYRCSPAFLALGAATIILLDIGRVPATLAVLILIVYLVSHYVGRFKLAFTPTEYFGNVVKHLRKLTTSEEYKKNFAIPKELEAGTEEYQKKHIDRLHSILCMDRFVLLVARKLKRAKDSHLILKYSVCALAYTFALTVVTFGFVYFGLWQIAPENFVIIGGASLFSFLIFSFDTFVNRATTGISAAGHLVQFATVVEFLFAIVVGLVLIYLFTDILYKRYDDELEGIIGELNHQGNQLEQFMVRECNLSIPEALTIVIAAKADAADLLNVLDPE